MNKKQLSIFIASSTIFLVFVLTTSPYHLPLIFVVVPGISFIVAAHSLLRIGVGYMPVKKKVGSSIVTVLTAVLSVLAVLLSVGQLTFRDFALLLALALVGMFYVSRMLDR